MKEEELKRKNIFKKNQYKKLSEKLNNLENLEKIEDALETQKQLIVNNIFFYLF